MCSCCDDLIGPAECATAAQRAKASDRFWSVLEPMLTPDGQIIVLGTRWHEDDLYAELMAKGWPAMVRPALAADGQALWPARWPAARPAAKREELGSAIFDLQYQNDPSGMGGNVFRREWFHYVDALPTDGLRRAGIDLNASASERPTTAPSSSGGRTPSTTCTSAGPGAPGWTKGIAPGSPDAATR